MIIKKYVEKNKRLLLLGFLLTIIDIVSTIVGLYLGGQEKMIIADFFLQYGYVSFMTYMITSRLLFLLYIIYAEYLILYLINNKAREITREKKCFTFIKYIITRSLIIINTIWIIVAVNNTYQIYKIFF